MTDSYKFGLETQGELALKKTEGVKYGIGRISNDATKTNMLKNYPEIAKAALLSIVEAFYDPVKEKKFYVGLQKNDNNVVRVSYDEEKRILSEIANSYFTYHEIIKFLDDYLKICRMRQELTIDYAKKLTDLSGITYLLTDRISARGLKPIKFVFDKQNKIFCRGDNLNDPPVQDKKIDLKDDLYIARELCSAYTDRTINGINGVVNFIETQEPLQEIEDALNPYWAMPEHYAFYQIKQMYNDIVGGIMNAEDPEYDPVYVNDIFESELESTVDYKDSVNRLSNMLRLMTHEMTPEERAAHIKLCSKILDKEGNEINESKFYMQICKEEYLLWLLSLGLNAVDFIGEELHDDFGAFSEGDEIEFTNGNNESAHIENNYTGKLKVFKNPKNGKLYAGKLIKDSIKVPETNGNILVRIDANWLKDVGGVNNAMNILANRMHSKCILKYDEKSRNKNKCFIKIRKDEDTLVSIPIFIDYKLAAMFKDKVANITDVDVKTLNIAKTGLKSKVIYLSLDFE